MRLLTNPGSNLSEAQIERYQVTLLPQRIVVDGVAHDTRERIPLATVDGWCARAERWPSTIGTTATETVAAFQALAREGARDLIVVTTSRRIVNSYEAAVVARDTFLASAHGHGARIELVDSGVTDIGANLVCTLVGEAIAAGLPWDRVVSVAHAAAAELRLAFAPATLDYMVKGGKVSSLRRFVADMFGVRPLVGFLEDGTAGAVGTFKKSGESLGALAAWIRGQVTPGRRVWLGAFHAGDDATAAAVVDALARDYQVAATIVRPLSAAVYLHAGPGALGVAICPVDRLGWTPPTPGRV
jgi:DegV family protein with EDD domain